MRGKLQSLKEFLEENYEMTMEEFNNLMALQREKIEDEYNEMVNSIIGSWW